MRKTIIKGLIYITEDSLILLRPYFSGNFHTVDCTEYKMKKQIYREYTPEIAREFIKESLQLTYNGETYYECEYSPWDTEGMELLSSLDDIKTYDETTAF